MGKRVLVISKAEEDPSAYYRLIQYFENKKGVRCVNLFSKRQYRSYYNHKETKCKKAITGILVYARAICILLWDMLFYRSTTVVINRKIFPRYCPRLVQKGLKRYLDKRFAIWDFDDNIFWNGEISDAELEIYEHAVDRVVVTNSYLKSLLCERLQKKTDLLPTTDRDFEDVSLHQWNRVREKIFQANTINLIWVGTKGNLVYLGPVIKQLDQAAGKMGHKDVTLYVVSNMPFLSEPEQPKAAGQFGISRSKAAGQFRISRSKAAGQSRISRSKAAGQFGISRSKAAGQFGISQPKAAGYFGIKRFRAEGFTGQLQTEHLRIRNVRWTREGAYRLMQKMHIGLMPLTEDAFTKGKGAFKAVQYIGAGLPTIASPVGFNKAVVVDGKNGFLTDSEWGECMGRITQSFEGWEQYSLRAREHWEQNFNSKRNMEYWEQLL